MIRFWNKRAKNTIITEHKEQSSELEAIRREIKNHIAQKFAGSLAIRMVDSGSCNACAYRAYRGQMTMTTANCL